MLDAMLGPFVPDSMDNPLGPMLEAPMFELLAVSPAPVCLFVFVIAKYNFITIKSVRILPRCLAVFFFRQNETYLSSSLSVVGLSCSKSEN